MLVPQETRSVIGKQNNNGKTDVYSNICARNLNLIAKKSELLFFPIKFHICEFLLRYYGNSVNS